jgi:S-adenosylmethionine decarboxylase proenzyme
METSGRHLLAEYYGCGRSLLDDLEALREILLEASRAAGATPVETVFHRFSPQGITGVVVIEESHFSIHSWPEHGYAAVDFFTCGSCRPELAHEVLRVKLGATRSETMMVHRGQGLGGDSIQVQNHEVDSSGRHQASQFSS